MCADGARNAAGARAASLYRHGREETKLETGCHAIVAALHALGITAGLPSDAFDTLAPGRYRRTDG